MKTSIRPKRSAAAKTVAFALLQLLMLSVLAVVIAGSRRDAPQVNTLPSMENEPLVIRPEYDNPLVITDDQLTTVLRKLRPNLAGRKPKINHVDHALRFWGVEADFNDPQYLTGVQMRRMLTDHRIFAEVWGEDARPLLIQRPEGVAVRTQEGHGSSSHVDHTLATLAEVGTTLGHPVATPQGTTNVGDVMGAALRQFSLNQQEYEWTALACAAYVATPEPWYSKEGQEITFDRLARRIMRGRYGQGCCYGNHRIYTLTILLRADQQRDLFSEEARQEVIQHLREATRRLVGSQSAEGYWDRNWPDGSAKVVPDDFSPLTRRLLATGHALEWWAMAPEELHPPREVLVGAGQWLVRQIEKMNAETIRDNYTFLTHVGRALALWRGDFPATLASRYGVATVRSEPSASEGGSADERPPSISQEVEL